MTEEQYKIATLEREVAEIKDMLELACLQLAENSRVSQSYSDKAREVFGYPIF